MITLQKTSEDLVRPAQKRMSNSLMRLRAFSPFFGTLALFAKHIVTTAVDTAATDGETIYFNPYFMEGLSDRELDAVMLHEVLHAALNHSKRRAGADPLRWNIAADIVVNGIVRSQSWVKLPDDAVCDVKLESFHVEEVYRLLEDSKNTSQTDCSFLGDIIQERSHSRLDRKATVLRSDYWKGAWNKAAAVERFRNNGKLPMQLDRLVSGINSPEIDWRSTLWRFLVHTPIDFEGFDRRNISRGLYLEELSGEDVRAKICVDTSGSINFETLDQFIAEIRGILLCYPLIKAELYYADAALYGPYELEKEMREPLVKGGGGTDFRPFFDAVTNCDSSGETLCIYLTDGFGEFPPDPNCPVLWVVAPGGCHDERFPFGEVVRLSN